MRIGIATDLHLGLREYGLKEREDDFYNQYQKVINQFIESDVDIVIFGGDIFDQARPSPIAMENFTYGIRNLLKNDIQVLNIIGNHGMIQSNDFVTADEFIFNTIEDERCFLLDEDHFLIQNDFGIFGLPYYFNFELDDFVKEVSKLNQKAKELKTKSNILVVHQAFKEYCGFTGEPLSINDIDISAFDVIVCGHIHDRKLISIDDNHIYLQPGSIERSSIAEARDEENFGKGIYIIDSDHLDINSIANGFCRIHCERAFLIADMYIDDISEIQDMKQEILEKTTQYDIAPLLFLTVHDSSGSFRQLTDLVKDLKSEFLTVNFNYIDESLEDMEEQFNEIKLNGARGALRMALNPLEDNQIKLGLDLFDNLKDGKDVSKLLEDYRQKNYPPKEIEHDNFDTTEIEEWLK